MRVAHDATLTEESAAASSEAPIAAQPLATDSTPTRVVTFLTSTDGLLAPAVRRTQRQGVGADPRPPVPLPATPTSAEIPPRRSKGGAYSNS